MAEGVSVVIKNVESEWVYELRLVVLIPAQSNLVKYETSVFRFGFNYGFSCVWKVHSIRRLR